MNCQSTSSNYSEPASTGAAKRGVLLPERRAAKPHQKPSSAGLRYSNFVEARSEGWEWEFVQDMFLASRPRFVGLAYSILRNKEDAEDAVQDAFLSASRHLRTFEGRSALTTWFTRIVLNAALMVLRKRKRSPVEFLAESHSPEDTPWAERIPDAQPDPETAYAKEETLERIDVLLGRMSPALRQAFTMTYLDELSIKEAGALLGVTAGTIKARLFRARRLLSHYAQRTFESPARRCKHSPLLAGNRIFPSSDYLGPTNEL